MEQNANAGVLAVFESELRSLWSKLPNKGLIIVLLATWVALFHFMGNSTLGYGATASLFNWLYVAYSAGGRDFAGSEDSFRFVVPAVVAFMLWLRRKEIAALNFRTWWPALLLVVFGLVTHVIGFIGQQPRISVVGLVAGLYGLTGLVWGYAWMRVSFLPFSIFAFAIPLGSLADPITFRLRLLVTQLVELICHYLLAIDVIREGTALKDATGRYQYEVAAACSGVRSLVATFAFAVVLSFVSLRGFWRRVVMIASAFPLAILGNLIRMMSIVIAAEIGGQEWGSWVHEGGPGGIFSLMPYIPAFIGLLVLERYLDDRPRQSDTRPPSTPERHPLQEASPAPPGGSVP